tara:strand:+ start:777 stop:1109 length:333 start_codon:yes stop_codon:yes gene_type:complete
MSKEAKEEWFGGPYDGTKNPPNCADGMVHCSDTGDQLFIFEVFDQFHFYSLSRQIHKKTKRRRYYWRYAGICPPEQWDRWMKKYGKDSEHWIDLEEDYGSEEEYDDIEPC